MATGSRIDFSLLPHLAINLRHSLVCPITDSRWLSLYNLWKPTRSRTRHRWSARHARQRHVDGPAIPRLSIMWLRSVTVLNWRADIRREGGEDNAGFRTGRMNTDWFVIIPGFHCTEGSGSSWLLCVEVKCDCGRVCTHACARCHFRHVYSWMKLFAARSWLFISHEANKHVCLVACVHGNHVRCGAAAEASMQMMNIATDHCRRQFHTDLTALGVQEWEKTFSKPRRQSFIIWHDNMTCQQTKSRHSFHANKVIKVN